MHRALAASGIVAAAAAGYLTASLVLGSSRDPKLEVLRAVGSQTHTANLDEPQETDRRHGATDFDVRKPARFAVWSQRGYSGAVSQEVVEILVESGRADALEPHLVPEARRRFQESIAEREREIRESALLAFEEWQRSKELLRADPECHVLTHTMKPQDDPAWPRIEAERARLEGSKGYVISDFPDAEAARRGTPRIHYFVDYERWPMLRELDRDFNRAAADRARDARRWIRREYERVGLELFQIED